MKRFVFTQHFKSRFKEVTDEDWCYQTMLDLVHLMRKYKPFVSFCPKHGLSSYYTFFYHDLLVTVVVDTNSSRCVTFIKETHYRPKYEGRT